MLSKTKHRWVYFCLINLFLLTGCIASTEEKIELLESRLDSFVDKRVRDVINVFGNPTKYSNRKEWDYEGNCLLFGKNVRGFR